MALVSNAVSDGVNAQTYKTRAVLLKQIFNDNLCKSQSNGSLYVLNTACTGQFIIKKVFEHFPSIILTFVCPTCLDRRSWEDIIVIVNLPTDNLIFLKNVMEN
jgi:hypothetical protein